MGRWRALSAGWWGRKGRHLRRCGGSFPGLLLYNQWLVLKVYWRADIQGDWREGGFAMSKVWI